MRGSAPVTIKMTYQEDTQSCYSFPETSWWHCLMCEIFPSFPSDFLPSCEATFVIESLGTRLHEDYQTVIKYVIEDRCLGSKF